MALKMLLLYICDMCEEEKKRVGTNNIAQRNINDH